MFPEEEGSRFGIACLGSRLLTGDLDPAKAAGLRDADGVTFAEAAAGHGLDPAQLGRDEEALGRIGVFVELHVEQGRGLVDLGQPVAVGSSILGHGRWRLRLMGEGNHAGTTLMSDRRDPMVAAGAIIGAIRDIARGQPEARATVGRLVPVPGGTNVIASQVDLWLDARHPDDTVIAAVVAAINDRAAAIAADEGCTATLVEESVSPTVQFDAQLRDRIRAALPAAPLLPTGAGHDAGVLATEVPTGMVFVRNPTGVSHSPSEHVDDPDTDAGAHALADGAAQPSRRGVRSRSGCPHRGMTPQLSERSSPSSETGESMNDQDEKHIDEWHRGYAAATRDRPDVAGFATSWPLAYVAVATPDRAVVDAAALAELQPGRPYVTLAETVDGQSRFTVAVVERPLTLGEVLPILQSLGLEVLTEQPYELTRPDGSPCWLYDFLLELPAGLDGELAGRLENAFRAVWAGQAETDPFNRLVTVAGLTWHEAAVLRAYGQYLHQLGRPWGRTFTATTMTEYPAISRGLSDLFELRFGPGGGTDTLQLRSGCAAPWRLRSTRSTTSPPTRSCVVI